MRPYLGYPTWSTARYVQAKMPSSNSETFAFEQGHKEEVDNEPKAMWWKGCGRAGLGGAAEPAWGAPPRS